MKDKRFIIIIAAVILVLGFLMTFAYSMENQVERSGGIVIPKEAFTNGTYDLTSRVISRNEPNINDFSAYISLDDLSSVNQNEIHIIIYRLNAQAYEIYFNDIFIGSVGDMDKGRSHTYNSANAFRVSSNIFEESNKITIRSYGEYMTGLERDSVGITDELNARKITEVIHLLTSGFSMMGLGVILFGILISLLSYFRSDRQNKTLVYLSIAVAFLGVYCLEYLNLPHLAIPYSFFKKMIVVSLFSCIFFFGLAYNEYYKKWHLTALSTFILIVVFTAAVFTRTLITFKYIYNITSIGIAVSFIIWFLNSIFDKEDSEEKYILASSTLMLIIVSLSDIIVFFIAGGVASTSIINHVLIFMYILTMIMNIELHRRNMSISSEKRQRSHFYIQSITDSLTGAYNKKYILDELEKTIPPLSIAMLDLDNFKDTNDTYGHQGGDFALEYVASKMKDEFRDTDLIGRYGGDEFIVILDGCSERNAFEIMNRFRMHLEFDKIYFDEREMKLTTSVGISYCRENLDTAKLIKAADEALYRAKNSGRNRVSI